MRGLVLANITMKKIIISTIFLLILHFIFAQKTNVIPYLKENSYKIDLTNPSFPFPQTFYANDLFFFGFVHGSEKTQVLDLELLKNLLKNGIYNYAPEIDYSLAYFFNQYLITGNEEFLNFACEFYKTRVPQDASIQFKNKWKELYKFNKQLPKSEQILVIGLDKEYSKELTLTHIAHIAPTEDTGIPIVDSLKFFKTLEINKINIISGKPIYKSGKNWDYFFGTEKTSFYKRFVSEYKKDSLNIINSFGKYSNELKHLMNQPENYNREKIIFRNFKKIAVPIIQKRGKIYANYGYFHIQQEKINGITPLAKYIKDNCNIKLVSIVGMLTDSECLKHRKYKSNGTIIIRETKFKKALYNGYSTSKSYDGDYLFEKVNGIDILKKISTESECMIFTLNGKNSPFVNTMLFADFKRGSRKWKIEKDKNTTDYFQYVILIKKSKSNIPLEE